MDGVRPRARVTAAVACASYVYVLRVVDKLPIYELRNFWVSIWRRVPIG